MLAEWFSWLPRNPTEESYRILHIFFLYRFLLILGYCRKFSLNAAQDSVTILFRILTECSWLFSLLISNTFCFGFAKNPGQDSQRNLSSILPLNSTRFSYSYSLCSNKLFAKNNFSQDCGEILLKIRINACLYRY